MSRADIMAGKAYVSLYTKQDAFTRGLQSARADLNKFGSDMMAVGAKMVAMTAVIAAPIAFAVKTFSDFDDAMRAVGAVSQATADQLKSMTDVAKNLGATTSFTALQVAQLMTELGRAGFKPDQVNAMTGAVLDLARATGTDATLASGIMAASIRQFGLEATDAARVADVLTMGANATFNSVESLGEALKYAGPVAKNLGMSLEETVAILGTLGNVGIQGSEAGTALRRLGVISAATGEKLKSIFDISNVDAAGQLKPLVQIMDEIGKKIKDLPVAERVAKMNEAFGLLGITASSVLSETAMSTVELANSLKTADGTAAKAAKSMDSGLGGAFRIIMSAAEGLSIAIGEALAGSIKSVTETITRLISAATTWVGANQGVVITLTAMTFAAGAFGAALIATGVAAKVMAVGISAAMTVVGVVKSVMAIAAAAISMFGTVTTAVGTAMYVFSSSIAIANGLAAASAAIAGVLSAAWSAAGVVISAVWAVITAPILPFIIAAGVVVTLIGAIAASAGLATVKAMSFTEAWTIAKDALFSIIDVVRQVGGVLMTALQQGDYDIAFKAAMAGIRLVLATSLEAMKNLWFKFWNGAWKAAETFFKNVAEKTIKIVSATAQIFTNPVAAGMKMQGILSDIAKNTNLSFGIDTKGMADSARAELKKLEAELAARQKDRDSKKTADEIKAQDPEVQKATQQAELQKKAAEIRALRDSGHLTDEEAAKAMERLKGGSAEEADAEAKAEQAASAFERETEALEAQIIALREGEEAAERFRLAKQGLSEEQINSVMGMKAEQKALEAQKQAEQDAIEKKQEASQRLVGQVQDIADADYEKNKLTPAQVAMKEKAAIERGRQQGLIDDKTAAEATAQADIRQAEKEHQERLKKFRGEGDAVTGTGKDVASVGLKMGGASAATFSAQSLLSMGSGAGQAPQLRAMIATQKAIEMQTQQAQEQSDAQIAAIKQSKMKHT